MDDLIFNNRLRSTLLTIRNHEAERNVVSRSDCIIGVSAALEYAKATYCHYHISKILKFFLFGYLKSFVIL